MSNLYNLLEPHVGHKLAIDVYYDYLGEGPDHTTDDGFMFLSLVCCDCDCTLLDSKNMDVLRFNALDILHNRHLVVKSRDGSCYKGPLIPF